MADPPPLYVGYLMMPPRHRAFVIGVCVGLVVFLLGGAALIAGAHRDPGDGIWDTGMERTWRGVVRMSPYPMLVDEHGEAWLLVGMGKFAVHDQVEPFSGKSCEIRGFALTRANRRMIELAPDDAPIVETGDALPSLVPAMPGRSIVVTGEIVDGKCYLGAMKPGDGKSHKSCAVLCIEGGLPPLVVGDVPGEGQLYPLLLVDGSPTLPRDLLDLVAEPVRIEGMLREVYGLPVLGTAPEGITLGTHRASP